MKETAVYAVTRKGGELGRFLAKRLGGDLFLPQRFAQGRGEVGFENLVDLVKGQFSLYENHIFITAAGIAVRAVASCIQSKDEDPAVVVLDQQGRFCISLLSGHLGGANDLARRVATLTGGQAVITTASDTEGLISVDLVAREKGMAIANIEAVKEVNGAILAGLPIQVFDPEDRLGLRDEAPRGINFSHVEKEGAWISGEPGIWVSWRRRRADTAQLLFHPKCLVAGIGCNRGVGSDEITRLIRDTFEAKGLSMMSLKSIASIEAKRDEEGLLRAARRLGLDLVLFNAADLAGIDVPNPSRSVGRYMGVTSVCEAAALLGAGRGRLIVPKTKTENATLAVALER